MGIKIRIKTVLGFPWARLWWSMNYSDWKLRNILIEVLKARGFSIRTVANPARLYAYKGGEQYCLDVKDGIWPPLGPIVWRTQGYFNSKTADELKEEIESTSVITNIPSDGVCGHLLRGDTKHLAEVRQIIKGVESMMDKVREVV